MPEPTSTAAGTAAVLAAAAAMPVLHAAPAIAPQIVILGYAIGLRADVLLAGFAGSMAALAFFNTVPSSGDTWRALLQTSLRRMWWCLASSLTAGYMTPLLMLVDGAQLRIPESLMLSVAFVAGGGAQRIFGKFINDKAEKAAKLLPAAAGGNDAA